MPERAFVADEAVHNDPRMRTPVQDSDSLNTCSRKKGDVCPLACRIQGGWNVQTSAKARASDASECVLSGLSTRSDSSGSACKLASHPSCGLSLRISSRFRSTCGLPYG
eukprot:6175296-Pleurochrysis_carterae.AAC.2